MEFCINASACRFVDDKCIVISSLSPRNSNCYIDSNISIFIGNAIQTVKSNDPVKIISVRGTAFDAADATGGSAANDKGKNYSTTHVFIQSDTYPKISWTQVFVLNV